MIMAREMKYSGIEWIGDIPADWKVSRVKHSVRWKSVKGQPDATVLSLYRDYGVIPKDSRDDNHNVTSLDTSGYKVVSIGDFVINKMKAWQGSMAVSEYAGIVSPAYHVCEIVNPKLHKKYFHHLMRNHAYLPEYTRLSTGLRIGQWDLGFDDFKNIPFILPPLEEQRKIVEFIDHTCAEIDAVIEKTKATIEEYKKLKQSVITEAVTKGIRGDRPMKDSGIEWIGEIPSEWDVSCLKRYCRFKTGVTPSTANSAWFDGDWNWFTPCDFNDNYYLTDSQRKLSLKAKEDGVAVIIPANTVVIIGIGGTAGKIGLTTDECSCNQQITALLTDSVYHKYLMYWMVANTKFLKDTALYTTLPILNNETIGEYLFVAPTNKCEQKEIADYLDQKCAEIDTLIAKKTALLEEMEAYKKSVIYEYVTGKKEVER
jgi:type I restriction enzyme S subunit